VEAIILYSYYGKYSIPQHTIT